MTSDYYEPHARFQLRRSVVLAGQIGCGARLIGRTLSARTGLPFTEIDRSIEHVAGRALDRLAIEDGPKSIAERARAALERLVVRPPFGVVVVDLAWPTFGVRDCLRARTDFVHIQRPTDHLVARWPTEMRRAGDWIFATMPSVDVGSSARPDTLLGPSAIAAAAPESSAAGGGAGTGGDPQSRPQGPWGGSEIQRRLSQRAPLLAEATTLLDAGEQHEHRLTEVLIDWLEPFSGDRLP